jgi:hypothetical protein
VSRHNNKIFSAKVMAFVIALLGLSLLSTAWAVAPTGGRVIEDVNVDLGATSNVINIEFALTVQYITHKISKSGQILEIKVSFPRSAEFDLGSLETRESVRLTERDGLPFAEVSYEGDIPGVKLVVITFKRPVRAQVSQGKDFRSLVVTVAREKHPVKVPEPESRPAVEEEIPAVKKSAAAPALAPAPVVHGVDLSFPYVVTLQSSRQQPTQQDVADLDVLRRYRVYVAEAVVSGNTWYRLRLGFFANKDEAERVLAQVKHDYPDAWIDKAGSAERQASDNTALNQVTERAPPKPVTAAAPVPGARPLSEERADKLMEQARQAMVDKKYRKAISYYTRVLRSPEVQYHQQAQELLGLAREKNGQLAHAKAEYENYLKRYPEGEDAKRVKQRLQGLLTARKQAREPLKAGAERKEAASRTSVSGSFSQFYRFDGSRTDATGSQTDQSLLLTDGALSTRTRTDDYDIRFQFNGSNQYDFLIDSSPDGLRTSNLYVDVADRNKDFSLRLGRQSRSTGGVLGRFDGALFGYRLAPKTRLNLVAGSNVNLSQQSNFQDDKYFYGASLDFGRFNDHLDLTAYAIQQVVDGITDRTAVGGEVRYNDPKQSYFSLLDYDIHYDDLSTFLLLANWRFDNKATVNLQVDYRKSPLLTTSNALQGQPVTSIRELLDIFPEGTINDLAEDRTATSKLVTVSATYPLNDRYQVSGDVTWSNLSSTPASGGVDATESSGDEYFYSVQMLGKGIFTKSDISLFGIRYADAKTSDTYTLTANTRFRINNKWRINPRLIYDHRNRDSGTTIRKIKPSGRFEYRWDRKLTLELEAGAEWETDSENDENDRQSYFLFAGYRKDFY